MSASGKKGKKGKKTTVPLSEFLGNKNVPQGFDKKVVNWADVTEDDDLNGMVMPQLNAVKEEIILPSAPKAARANEIDTTRVPFNAPFKAYIGNVPYTASEDELKMFFDMLNPISVQLPRDDRGTGKTRGFGYVEFETRDNLIEALKMSGKYLHDRTINVSLPDEGGRDGERRDRGGGYMGDDDRTAGDWRKAPRSEQSLPSSQRDYSSAPRPDMSEEMAGPWRRAAAPAPDAGRRNGYDNPPARNYESSGGGFRESRYESQHDDRRPPGGAFSDRRTGGAGFENFNRGYADDRRRDGGYDNSYRESYREAPRQSYRDDYNPRSAQPDRGSDYERPVRSSGYDRPPVRSEMGHGSEAPAAQPDEAPKTRPKLQLKPRTVPLDEIAAPAPVASKSIFGDAKPVDTMKKVLEVEKKLESLGVQDPVAVQPETNRTRTVSSGSGSGSIRSRKESESDRPARDEPKLRNNEPRNFGPRDSDYGRRNDRDRPAPDRGYDSRYERRGPPPPHRSLPDSRDESRPYQDRPSGGFARSNDRRDERPPVRPREDDRRPERRPDAPRERDNNNGVKQSAPKREPEYTMSNKYDALNDEEYDASTRYSAQD